MSLAAAVDPVGVVEFARAINTQSHQKAVFLEEHAPVLINQNAICLECMLHRLTWATVFLDQFDGLPEEAELHERRLAALPRNRDFGRAMRLQ
jgi:hypothetical protein